MVLTGGDRVDVRGGELPVAVDVYPGRDGGGCACAGVERELVDFAIWIGFVAGAGAGAQRFSHVYY